MATNSLPTMSTQGWASSPEQKADFILAYVFESEANQSYLFSGEITNIQHLIQRHAGNIYDFLRALEDKLNRLVNKYFDLGLVTITSDLGPENVTNKVSVGIRIKVTQGNREFDFSKTAELVDSKYMRFVNENNYGS